MTGLADDLLNLLREHPTAPHHFHNEVGDVSESPLSGRPLKDLRKVLSEIEKWLSRSTENRIE